MESTLSTMNAAAAAANRKDWSAAASILRKALAGAGAVERGLLGPLLAQVLNARGVEVASEAAEARRKRAGDAGRVGVILAGGDPDAPSRTWLWGSVLALLALGCGGFWLHDFGGLGFFTRHGWWGWALLPLAALGTGALFILLWWLGQAGIPMALSAIGAAISRAMMVPSFSSGPDLHCDWSECKDHAQVQFDTPRRKVKLCSPHADRFQRAMQSLPRPNPGERKLLRRARADLREAARHDPASSQVAQNLAEVESMLRR